MILRKLTPAQRKAIGTRKHSLIVTVYDSGSTVTATAPYWDEGSRTDTWEQWRDGARRPVVFPRYVWPERPTSTEVLLTPDTALVEGGTFRGKPSTLHVHATRDWLDAVLGKGWEDQRDDS